MAARRKRSPSTRPIGRPTALTPVVHEIIVTTIRAGNYFTVACARAGVTPKAGYEWMQRGRGELMDADPPMMPWTEDDPDVYPEGHEKAGEPYPGRFREFGDAVIRAEADAEAHAVGVIRQAMVQDGDWRASEAWLKRRHPERWREETVVEQQGQVTHTLAPQLPDEEKVKTILESWREAGIDPEHEAKRLPPGSNGKPG